MASSVLRAKKQSTLITVALRLPGRPRQGPGPNPRGWPSCQVVAPRRSRRATPVTVVDSGGFVGLGSDDACWSLSARTGNTSAESRPAATSAAALVLEIALVATPIWVAATMRVSDVAWSSPAATEHRV